MTPRPGRTSRDTGRGGVVATAGEGRQLPGALGWVLLVVVAVVAAGLAVLGARPLLDASRVGGVAGATLNAAEPGTASGGSAGGAGTTRLQLVDPRRLLDTRAAQPLARGAQVAVPLAGLPRGATAVLVEVTLTGALGPGEVTLASAAASVPVLRVPRAGAATSSAGVIPIGTGSALRVQAEPGGHLVVVLVAAFEPAVSATAGRVVAVPATRVLDLDTALAGTKATVDLAGLPALADAGPVAAVMLQISADVGDRGGYVALGPTPGELPHEVRWGATGAADRARNGFVLVPVSGTRFSLEYHAGSLLRADLVGYVTGTGAADSAAGLVMPLAPQASTPVSLRPRAGASVGVLAPGDSVLPDRVSAAFVGLSATGEQTPGGVAVHAPGTPAPEAVTLSVGPAGRRNVLTLSGVSNGALRVEADAAVSATVAVQALVLSG